jgi:hypothetical protein
MPKSTNMFESSKCELHVQQKTKEWGLGIHWLGFVTYITGIAEARRIMKRKILYN